MSMTCSSTLLYSGYSNSMRMTCGLNHGIRAKRWECAVSVCFLACLPAGRFVSSRHSLVLLLGADETDNPGTPNVEAAFILGPASCDHTLHRLRVLRRGATHKRCQHLKAPPKNNHPQTLSTLSTFERTPIITRAQTARLRLELQDLDTWHTWHTF